MTSNEQMQQPRELLIAFMNGSYKKLKSTNYKHNEWIAITKEGGKQIFINTVNVKYVEEL